MASSVIIPLLVPCPVRYHQPVAMCIIISPAGSAASAKRYEIQIRFSQQEYSYTKSRKRIGTANLTANKC
jgi:hypothetical protein